jgi:hypothetical protein
LSRSGSRISRIAEPNSLPRPGRVPAALGATGRAATPGFSSAAPGMWRTGGSPNGTGIRKSAMFAAERRAIDRNNTSAAATISTLASNSDQLNNGIVCPTRSLRRRTTVASNTLGDHEELKIAVTPAASRRPPIQPSPGWPAATHASRSPALQTPGIHCARSR